MESYNAFAQNENISQKVKVTIKIMVDSPNVAVRVQRYKEGVTKDVILKAFFH